MRGEESGALRRPRGFWLALLALAALLAAGAAGGQPSPGDEQPGPALQDGVVSLADGVEVPELEAPEAQSASVEGEVAAALKEDESDSVIVRLREQADLPSLAAEARGVGRARGRSARVRSVVEALRDTAEATQPPVRDLLRDEEAAGRARDVRSYWIFNGFAATLDQAALDRLARHPAVESIELDEVLTVPETQSAPRLPTWGLQKVDAPKTWGDYGFTGEGVVVGVMDTGVDGGHPALRDKFRGRNGDLTSSWYVPTGENYPEPGDGNGHGTHVTGTILGGPPGEVVGVAPDAEWIAVKIFRDSGSTTTSIIHDGFQWMLPPGSFPESFGVGATDINDQIASFSSRGPAIWDGVTHVKPQISAPGHQIFSSWPRQLGLDYHTI